MNRKVVNEIVQIIGTLGSYLENTDTDDILTQAIFALDKCAWHNIKKYNKERENIGRPRQ